MRLVVIAVRLAIALTVCGAARGRAEPLPIEAVPLPPRGDRPAPIPRHLLRGPDGAVWFTGDGVIGRLGADRAVQYFGFAPVTGSMIVGRDDHLWMVLPNDDQVWRFNLQGGGIPVAEIASAVDLAAEDRGTIIVRSEPDRQTSSLTRIGVAGSLEQIAVPQGTLVSAMCTGPDGHVWVARDRESAVSRIENDGSLTTFALGLTPFANHVTAMAAASDLWLTDWFSSRITRLQLDGQLTGHAMPWTAWNFPSMPQHLIRGPQGSMWYTGQHPSQLVRVRPDGRVTAFDIETNFPSDLVEGFDGALWLTDQLENHLWRAVPPPLPPAPPPLRSQPRFYVASQFFNEITTIDLTGEVLDVFPLTRETFALSAIEPSPDGRVLYASLGYALQAIDSRTHRVTRTYPVSGDSLRISPDGSTAYVWFRFSDLPILAIDLASGQVRPLPAPGWIYQLALAPDGGRLYVPASAERDSGGSSITVLDASSGRTVDEIPVSTFRQVFLNRAGTRAFVPAALPELGAYAYGFRVIDLATHEVLDRQALHGSITAIVPSPDDRTAFVAYRQRQVDVYDVTTRRIVASSGAQTRGDVVAAAMSPDGITLALIDYSDALYLADTRTLTLTRRLPVSANVGEPLSYEPVDITVVDPAPTACVGDCDSDGHVTIEELIAGVHLALGEEIRCAGYPQSPAGGVAVDDLVAAVNAALFGCAAA